MTYIRLKINKRITKVKINFVDYYFLYEFNIS